MISDVSSRKYTSGFARLSSLKWTKSIEITNISVMDKQRDGV